MGASSYSRMTPEQKKKMKKPIKKLGSPSPKKTNAKRTGL